eukprot:gnl/TRDRNA2_/TRDRNA2_171102_c1_seq2.p1 gnl/TRDRNA2_/TRDRNA2_171102_c1~~gnl/TRDRNA2_/TRDRNA2_171102_c1_seq2.p1  ORF type:complete len:527 (-),score=95.21 gnl/TRDRNA2_/TRDRNA2_171102_c1_seq2:138-1718(-)
MGGSCSCWGGALPDLPSPLRRLRRVWKDDDLLPKSSSASHLLPNNSGHSPSEFYDLSEKTFGEGAFGTVRLAKSRASGEQIAIKLVLKELVPNVELFRNEILFHSEMDHPSIARLHECFEDHEHVYIVMEACSGGTLYHSIKEHSGPMPELTSWALIKQALFALNYMHTKGFVHRDIKPENFVVKAIDMPLIDKALKLIDFGSAQRFGPGRKLTTRCGTVLYMAPEIQGGAEYTEKVDVWSSGVLLYVLLSGFPPFGACDESPAEILAASARGELSFDGEEWAGVSELAKFLLQDMINPRPRRRICISQALESGWARGQETELAELRATSPVSSPRNSGALHDFDQEQLPISRRTSLRKITANKFRKSAYAIIARHLDDSDIGELRDIFTRLDRNGDGTLTLQEMQEGCEAAGLDSEDVQAIFDKIDPDHCDAAIDYTEFLSASMDETSLLGEKACWEAFRVFDRRGSGKISKTDLCEMLSGDSPMVKHATRIDPIMVDEIMRDCDLDGDGEINFSEFMGFMRTAS